MAKIPLNPSFAHLLLCANQFDCVEEILTAVSMLSSDNVLIQPHIESEKKQAGQIHKQFASRDGDFITLINIYEAWIKSGKSKGWCHRSFVSHRGLSHACSVREQIARILHSMGIKLSTCLPEREPVLKCIVKGLSRNIAGKTTNTAVDAKGKGKGKNNQRDFRTGQDNAPYRTIEGNQDVHIHPSSSLFSKAGARMPKHLVYAEILVTTKCYMRYVSVMDIEWLAELEISHINTHTSGSS
jgi:HrpA-like RNA helicase